MPTATKPFPATGASVTFIGYDGTLVAGTITHFEDETTAVVRDLATGESWGLDVLEDSYTTVTA